MDASHPLYEFVKRAFDIFVAVAGLVLLSPLLALVAIAVKLDSPGPVFFRGARVGRNGRLFHIFKFRSMRLQDTESGPGITANGDARITRVGRILRETKLDEIPQLFNVLRSEMSLVGPRPEDPRWVEKYSNIQRKVLQVRPGMTSLASLRYRREEELLTGPDWGTRYENVILPDKLALDLEYLATRGMRVDLGILLRTLWAVTPRVSLPTRLWLWMYRYLTWGAVDAVIVLFSYGLAFFLRALTTPLEVYPAVIFGLVAVLLYLLLNWLTGIYDRQWRYAGGQDSVYIIASTFFASLILGAVDVLFFPVRPVPLSVFLIGAVFVILLSTAARFRGRLWRELSLISRDARKRFSQESFGTRTLIVGAGEEGQLLAWQLRNRLRGMPYDLVAFVDDDPNKQTSLVNNTRVEGTRKDIPRLCRELNVQIILIAINPRKIRNPRELLEICRSTDAQIKVVPSVLQMLAAPASQPVWEDAREETLLNRQKFSIDDAACRELLAGKSVLVTGACGSIGSELARQVAGYGPASLYLLDNNETGLHDLALELSSVAKPIQTRIALADITDAVRIDYVFRTLRPEVVFHAAAYKHVPMLEEHPYEAVRVNIIGTRNVHNAALRHGTERFIFISSDKAVNPTNMLGLTKRVGEVLVVHNGKSQSMLSAAVRFGNVLGSRGSVLPTFTRQIDLGGPVTLTDAEMTRYFMSTSEAVSLVIQAATLTGGGEIFVLNMGEQVRILDLALRLIRMRGLRPYIDIDIQFTGARAGEKIREELLGVSEERAPTAHQAIWRIRDQNAPYDPNFESHLESWLANLNVDATLEELSLNLNGLLKASIQVTTAAPIALATRASEN